MIVPLVMSQAVELPPALLAFGVVVIGSLFGLMGVLLAVPLLSAVVILVQELWIAPNEARAARDPPGRTGARSGSELHDGGIAA